LLFNKVAQLSLPEPRNDPASIYSKPTGTLTGQLVYCLFARECYLCAAFIILLDSLLGICCKAYLWKLTTHCFSPTCGCKVELNQLTTFNVVIPGLLSKEPFIR